MSCNRLELLPRLMLDDPEVLNSGDWKTHLAACEECREEQYSMDRSLAIFLQFEAQSHAGAPSGPDWEQFSATLTRHQGRRAGLHRFRLPMVAASVAALLVSGWFFWPFHSLIGFQAEAPFAEQAESSPTFEARERSLIPVSNSSPARPDITVRVQPQFRRLVPMQRSSSGLQGIVTSEYVDSEAAVHSESITESSQEADVQPTTPRIFFLAKGHRPAKAPVILFRTLKKKRIFGLTRTSNRNPVIRTLPAYSPAIGGSSSSGLVGFSISPAP